MVFFVGAKDAGEAFPAVERDPGKLAAVVVEKTGSQANSFTGSNVSKCGVMIWAIKIFNLT